jgi:CRISPR-associated endonuclease/helicase Cas3
LGRAVVQAREIWDFVKTAELFQMITDNSVPVLVDYTPAGDSGLRAAADRVVNELRGGRPVRPAQLRHLQPFLAALPRTTAQRMPQHLLTPLIGDLHVWNGPYDTQFGIDLTTENL